MFNWLFVSCHVSLLTAGMSNFNIQLIIDLWLHISFTAGIYGALIMFFFHVELLKYEFYASILEKSTNGCQQKRHLTCAVCLLTLF